MGWFAKNQDPITGRAKELNAEIAALEAQIRSLANQTQESSTKPKVRSASPAASTGRAASKKAAEPVFEDVTTLRKKPDYSANSPDHYNELGLRKYDLLAAWHRLWSHFHGSSGNNPKLVNFLAAGSLQGLRPLRYEKRVARNRFLALFGLLAVLLYGVIYFFLKQHH